MLGQGWGRSSGKGVWVLDLGRRKGREIAGREFGIGGDVSWKKRDGGNEV